MQREAERKALRTQFVRQAQALLRGLTDELEQGGGLCPVVDEAMDEWGVDFVQSRLPPLRASRMLDTAKDTASPQRMSWNSI